MITWLVFFVLPAAVIAIIQASGATTFRIESSKTVYESFTDKLLLNVSISKLKGLTVYVHFLEEFTELYTDIALSVDLYDKNSYDFDVVRRTIDTCKLFKESTYEPVIQYLYKRFFSNGNFPTDCPIRKGVYYIKDMKSDPKDFPEMMADKKAMLKVKHLSKEDQKMKLLAYYEVHFAIEKVHGIDGSNRSQTKPRKPNRTRTME